MPKLTFEDQLERYADCHRHPLHRLIQGVGVPLIAFSLVAIADGMIFGTPFGYPLTLAHLACLVAVVAYARAEPKLAVFIALLFAASIPLAAVVPRGAIVAAATVGAASCVASWWRYGRHHSFTMGQTLMTPLFLSALWLGSLPESSLRLSPAFGGRRVR